MRQIFLLTAVLFFSATQIAVAQTFTVDTQIDSTVMWIGNQTRLTFNISQPKGLTVQTPLFTDNIAGALEIVETLKPDSTEKDGYMSVNQSYIVTSFEDSLLFVPPYPFVSNGDTVWSRAVSLKVVQPFVIDTASNAIADIKPVFAPPFDLKSLLKSILFSQIGFVIFAITVLIIIYLATRKKKIREIFDKPKEIISPHIIAMQKLDKIRNEKIWQQGRIKEYFTELTDVLREYIERRFEVSTFEQTSQEILDSLAFIKKDYPKPLIALQQIFSISDLVKFAKFVPASDESEQCLKDAYFFVKEITSLSNEKEQDKIKEQELAQAELLRQMQWLKIKNKKIKGLNGLELQDVENEVRNGARFIRFSYCISIILVTFSLNSKIYFISKNEKPINKGWIYLIISILFGWWGIPWGPIRTIAAIKNAITGKDVTKNMMNYS